MPKKPQMMICQEIADKTCNHDGCYHAMPHRNDKYCVTKAICSLCVPVTASKPIPYVKPQTVHVVQRLIGKKMFSISARDTRKQARKLRDELQTVTGRRYRIVTAIIQEGK